MRRFLWEVSTYVLYPSRGQPMRSRARPFATSIGPVSCLAGMGTSPRPALAPHRTSSHLISSRLARVGAPRGGMSGMAHRRRTSRPVPSCSGWLSGMARCVPRAPCRDDTVADPPAGPAPRGRIKAGFKGFPARI